MFYNGYWFNTTINTAVLYMFISAFTVSGNVLVCLVFILDPFKQLRTLQNYYILNLAVSDLLMGLAAEPLLIATYWHYDNSADNSLFFAHYLFAIISGISSLTNMAALSVFRCISIKLPFTHHGIITRRRVLLSIVFLWIFSLQFSAVPLIGWRGRYYQIYLYGVGCFVPSTVIFLAYFGIFRAIKHHTSTLRRTGTIQNRALKNAVLREKATAKTLLIILGVFLASWGPFIFVDLLMVQFPKLRNEKWHLARDITLTITYFSSGINPVLYAWRVQQFRRAFLRTCCCKRYSIKSRRRLKPREKTRVPVSAFTNSALSLNTQPKELAIEMKMDRNTITTRL